MFIFGLCELKCEIINVNISLANSVDVTIIVNSRNRDTSEILLNSDLPSNNTLQQLLVAVRPNPSIEELYFVFRIEYRHMLNY